MANVLHAQTLTATLALELKFLSASFASQDFIFSAPTVSLPALADITEWKESATSAKPTANLAQILNVLNAKLVTSS